MRKWSPQRDRWLTSMYPDTSNRVIATVIGCSKSAVKNRAYTLGLKKSDHYMATGPGRFRPGKETWNKGQNFKAGGRSKETQFKKGHRPNKWVPVGTEVEDRDGYLKRKVRDDAPAGMSRKNWKFVHIIHWEQYHGRPVPPKHIVRMIDGDRRNFSRDNLVLVSRAENAVLNKFFAMKHPPEGGFEVLLNLARITLAAGKRKQGITA